MRLNGLLQACGMTVCHAVMRFFAGVNVEIFFFFGRGRNKPHTLHGKILGKKVLGLSSH